MDAHQSHMPRISRARSAASQLQILLHRYRAIRWVAATAAAAAVFAVLTSDNADNGTPSGDPENALESAPAAARLVPGTRGVTIPDPGTAFAAGDLVDVHEVRTGSLVVREALVIEVTEDAALVAVPTGSVDALVDALTTGGVILALVPIA